MEYKDVMMGSNESKKKVYEQINQLYLQGKAVRIREHKSGFPAITVDCEDIHIITDCISLEMWWVKKKKEQERR